jgi:cardiolipin synthase
MRLTVPNVITLLRMGLVPVFVFYLVHGHTRAALGLIVLAGVSDALDGAIARIFHQQSQLGAVLDPVADKLLLVSAYIVLALPSPNLTLRIQPWITGLVIARDVLLVLAALVLYFTAGVRSFPPTGLSKITTAFQIAAVVLVLLADLWSDFLPAARFVLYTVAGLTLASGLDYVIRVRRLFVKVPAAPPARGG